MMVVVVMVVMLLAVRLLRLDRSGLKRKVIVRRIAQLGRIEVHVTGRAGRSTNASAAAVNTAVAASSAVGIATAHCAAWR